MSDGLREAVERALDEMSTWCGPYGYPGVAAFIDRRDAHIRALLAEHSATPAEGVAEVAVEERDALAQALSRAVAIYGPVRVTKGQAVVLAHDEADDAAGRILASDWLRDHDAALIAKAKAEGRVGALREAADVVAGWDEAISRDAPHFAGWLHDRANEEPR